MSLLSLLVTMLFLPLMAGVAPITSEIVGQTVGSWRILRLAPKVRGVNRRCVARCLGCGVVKVVRVDHILHGKSKSCGCALIRDLTGLRSGRLKVLRIAAKPHPQAVGVYWEARCDCGKTIVGPRDYFVRKRPKTSCGCMDGKKAPRKTPPEPLVACIAYRPGIYNHRRIAVGEVLDVKVGSFCSSWLRRVPPATPVSDHSIIEDEQPERYTGANAALQTRLDSIRPFGVTAASRRRDDDDDTHVGRARTADDLDDFPEE